MRIATLLILAGLASSFADIVNYSYDDAGRLTKVDYGNGQSISYTYDKAGNLLSRQVSSADTAKAQRSSGLRRSQDNQSAPKPVASHRR
jgi:YD repeat-containing protein